MGIEENIAIIMEILRDIDIRTRVIENFIVESKPKDRQDKEKAIKDTMPTEMGC